MSFMSEVMLWVLEANWIAVSGSATSLFPGASQGGPAFASGLEEVDPAGISGPGWVPGLTVTPWSDRESRVPSGSTIMSMTGRLTKNGEKKSKCHQVYLLKIN